MLTSVHSLKVYIDTGYTDMRKSINGLSILVADQLELDPLSGHLFAFCNRRRDITKILYWDRNGFCLFQKRLSQGKFKWWPEKLDREAQLLAAHEVQLLLWNGNPEAASPVLWKKITPRSFFAEHT